MNRKNIQFAKDLFISWDDDGSGELEGMEIISPLINLGLAPNSDFAFKLLQALDSNTKKTNNVDDLKITLQDFIKIFRSNKVSESLLNLIQKETEKRFKHQMQPIPVSEIPKKRIEHPALVKEQEWEELQQAA